MGSLTLEIRKFLQNKNTVTVIGVVLAIFVLYFAYTMRVKSAVNPITVPYATEEILSTTRITEGMISTRQVPPSMLEGDVILNINEIVGKYVNKDVVIPKGSLFYRRAVVEPENLNRSSSYPDYPPSYELYHLPVSIYSTYGNAIVPNNYVDIWLTAFPNPSKRDKVMVGKLFSNVKILTVRAGVDDVFQNMSEQRIPERITFAMPPEYIQLLTAAQKLENYDVRIKVVPTHESLKDNPGEVAIASEELKNWINTNVQYVE